MFPFLPDAQVANFPLVPLHFLALDTGDDMSIANLVLVVVRVAANRVDAPIRVAAMVGNDLEHALGRAPLSGFARKYFASAAATPNRRGRPARGADVTLWGVPERPLHREVGCFSRHLPEHSNSDTGRER